MDNKINGRTPEEIKKGLECFITQTINGCDDEPCDKCVCYAENSAIGIQAVADGQALIQQLERERDEARNDLDTINYANTELHSAYEAMKRERDAAVELLHGFCGACANEGKHEICVECSRRLPFEPDDKDDYWQWRGVQEVE